jgi:RNA polymerase sigma factor (sigma-70 family)
MSNRTFLVEQNLGLAQVIAFDYANIPGVTLSEAVSEAQVALMRAADNFDSSKGEFTPYAARVLRNALNSLYAKQLRMARMFPKSLDQPPVNGSGDHGSNNGPFDRPDSQQDVRKSVKRRETNSILRDILRTLSPHEQLIIEHMRLGRSLSEIGNKLGVSKQAVHKVSSPALAKVKEALETFGYKGLDSQGFLKSASSKSQDGPG